jgi:murein DD-endopeptidase MepM/ murein hydrolase activator NlpD
MSMSSRRFSGVLWPIEVPRMTMPFNATWTRFYSSDRPHRGIDIAPWPGSLGRPVRSPIHGDVTLVGEHPAAGRELVITGSVPYDWGANDLRGRYVSFQAHEPFHIRMTHFDSIAVTQNALVAAGQHVGALGQTGTHVTGPHVHLEVRKGEYDDGLVVDPMHFFIAAIPGLRQSLIGLQ